MQRELGITTVSVTHDQVEALVMSDLIAVLDGGVIQQLGTPLDVYQRPANRFVADFLGESNLLEIDRWQVRDGRPAAVSKRGSATFVRFADGGQRPAAARWLIIRPENICIGARPQCHAEPVRRARSSSRSTSAIS